MDDREAVRDLEGDDEDADGEDLFGDELERQVETPTMFLSTH